jgi:hypothetical protein
MSIDQVSTTQASAPTVTVTAPAPIKAFDDDSGPSFHDVLDILNPLQHIPIINTLYRHLTGDEEGAVADVAGGMLWTGPIGLITSLSDLTVKAETGKSIGDNILSWLGFDDDGDTAAASNEAATKAAEAQQQQQQAQQTAAVTAPLPAITAQALSPLPARQRGDDRKDQDRREEAAKDGGSVQVGDYLVFGSGRSGQPLALTPPSAIVTAAATAPAGRESSAPSRQGSYLVFGGAQPSQQQSTPTASTSVAAASTAATVGRQGDYMVFGVSVPAPAAAPVQLAQALPVTAPMAPVSASVTAQTPVQAPAQSAPALGVGSTSANAVANSVPPGGGPAQLSPLPSRTFAAPPRRTQVTPNALPMPTTGTAAIPGHHPSQAVQPMTPDDSSWFAGAVNAGLDKYAAAQKLANQDASAGAAAEASQAAVTLH